MTDYSKMSDADLLKSIQQPGAADYSKLSDEDLLKAIQSPQAAPEAQASAAAAGVPGNWPNVATPRPQDQPAQQEQPSIIDRLQTNPVVGAPLQTVMRTGQGAEQLAAHGAASVSDLGGLAPNPVSAHLRSLADMVDHAIKGQNEGYEGAKKRVVAASDNPRVQEALINTGETEGNLVNPAGLAGNMVRAGSGVTGAAVRGAVSGAAAGASQPVTTENDDYWAQKVKQVGVGGLTGAVTGAAVEKLSQVKPSNSPKASTFKELASDSYDAAKATGATVPRTEFQAAIDSAEVKARDTVTYRPSLEPKAATAIDQIKKDLEAAGDNVTFADMDVARRVARKVLTSPDKNERAVAHTIIDGIDDYIDGLKAPEGDALTTARDLFARGSKLDTVERLVTKAQDAIGANQTRTKLDNAIRQQFRGLKSNERAFRQFSPEEQEAIKLIVRGKTVQNMARWAGKLSPTTSVPILGELGMIGHAVATGNETEALGISAAAGAGLIGQHVADTMGEANVNALRNTIAGRNALAAPRPAPNPLVWNPLPNLAVNALAQPRGQ